MGDAMGEVSIPDENRPIHPACARTRIRHGFRATPVELMTLMITIEEAKTILS
jgi:hypothetical protein